MLAPLLLALQSDARAGVPEDRLAVTRPACPAGPSAQGDVVVCGRRDDQRLRPLPDRPVPDASQRLTLRLPGGGAANLHAIQSNLPGATGAGAAVTVSVPLGRRSSR